MSRDPTYQEAFAQIFNEQIKQLRAVLDAKSLHKAEQDVALEEALEKANTAANELAAVKTTPVAERINGSLIAAKKALEDARAAIITAKRSQLLARVWYEMARDNLAACFPNSVAQGNTTRTTREDNSESGLKISHMIQVYDWLDTKYIDEDAAAENFPVVAVLFNEYIEINKSTKGPGIKNFYYAVLSDMRNEIEVKRKDQEGARILKKLTKLFDGFTGSSQQKIDEFKEEVQELTSHRLDGTVFYIACRRFAKWGLAHDYVIRFINSNEDDVARTNIPQVAWVAIFNWIHEACNSHKCGEETFSKSMPKFDKDLNNAKIANLIRAGSAVAYTNNKQQDERKPHVEKKTFQKGFSYSKNSNFSSSSSSNYSNSNSNYSNNNYSKKPLFNTPIPLISDDGPIKLAVGTTAAGESYYVKAHYDPSSTTPITIPVGTTFTGKGSLRFCTRCGDNKVPGISTINHDTVNCRRFFPDGSPNPDYQRVKFR